MYRPAWRFVPGQQFGGGDNFIQDYGITPGALNETTYGQIRRGPAPPQYRFQAPRAGVQADFRAPASGPLADNRAPAGTFSNLIRQGADAYVQNQQQQRATALRKGMKLARANNRVAAMRASRIFGTLPTGPGGGGGLMPPSGSPLPPPTGGPAGTTLPPPVGATPTPPKGVTPPSPPWAPAPPKKGPKTTPFGLPPMVETGVDTLTALARTAPDVEESPAKTKWRDEPTNPFPEGPIKPFDRSRMFDPTYKSSEERTAPPAKSRAQRRPRK